MLIRCCFFIYFLVLCCVLFSLLLIKRLTALTDSSTHINTGKLFAMENHSLTFLDSEKLQERLVSLDKHFSLTSPITDAESFLSLPKSSRKRMKGEVSLIGIPKAVTLYSSSLSLSGRMKHGALAALMVMLERERNPL